ncbi:MAG: DUF2461 domain-containing protein [Acetatifactor sp.]|nr:DUF2461 domain-containing protein [Acetatifactor sp.]
MFQGFNESTIRYYEAIRKENSKEVHNENKQEFLVGVKYPLEDLYFELFNYFSRIDSDLLSDKRRCISSAYNDARFCREAPIKEYFYIRFKLNGADKKNALGFFFDASLDGYKYGLNIYNMDAGGMGRIRDYMLTHRHLAMDVAQKFHESGLLEMQGEKYKRANYMEENTVLQEWLDRRRISFIHEEILNSHFFKRDILECILAAYDSAKDVYFMIKDALLLTPLGKGDTALQYGDR